jgi:hypothetical protein
VSAALVCADCGAVGYSTAYMQSSSIKQLMDAHGVCFTCGYWREVLAKKPDTVIDGRIYSVGDVRKPPNQRHAGMAGRRFDIEFFDGRRVTTHDLWAGSEIPERYRAQLPDTARFLGGAGFARIGDGGAWNASLPPKTAEGGAA